MKMKTALAAAIVLATMCATVYAQQSAPTTPATPPPAATAAPAVPELTNEQKLTVTNYVQRIQLAQLRIQALQAEFETARKDATAFVQSLDRECFDLDLDKLVYVAKPDCKPKAPAAIKK